MPQFGGRFHERAAISAADRPRGELRGGNWMARVDPGGFGHGIATGSGAGLVPHPDHVPTLATLAVVLRRVPPWRAPVRLR